MATFLYRLGRLAFSKRWYVALLWAAVLGAVGAGALSAPGASDEEFSMPGIESQKAFDLLEERFPGLTADGATARVVFVAPSGEKVTASFGSPSGTASRRLSASPSTSTRGSTRSSQAGSHHALSPRRARTAGTGGWTSSSTTPASAAPRHRSTPAWTSPRTASSRKALTNVSKHAAAHTARIRLTYQESHLTLTVTDDGTTPGAHHTGHERGSGDRPGYGLTGMRERAHSVGGSLSAGRRPQGGFEVTTDLPLRPCPHPRTPPSEEDPTP